MANPNVSEIGAMIKAFKLYGATQTAAGAGDNTEVTTSSVDRSGYGSGVFVFAGRSNAATNETLKLTLKISDSDDDSTFSADTTLKSAVTVYSGGASAGNFVYEVDIDLAKYKRYIRFKLTPDLSASGTDTAQWGAAFIAGGAVTKPA